MKTNSNGDTFEAWYRKANAECVGIAGLGIDDLADGPSYDSWADDVDPRDYAIERLEEEDFPFDDAPVTAPAPAPQPRKGFATAPHGTYETETIVLENGRTIAIRRYHSRNGRIEVV